mmetsp:Transcript_2445/g.5706  ORF Transcript_2445/g.5706 Transcript_2445/m.5706 type:complete len:80 (+) Transcript_2445:592-831(+)
MLMILMRMFCLCVNLYPLAAYKKELELNKKLPKSKSDAGATLDEDAEGDGEGEGEGVEGIENEDNEYENPDTSMNQEED